MKRARRFLSMLLTLCLLINLLPSTVLATNINAPFTDVKETDWFYEAVGYVYENGMMSGTGNNHFSPNVTTTRGMLVTILYRLEGSPVVSAASFDDVANGEYYANGVGWAAQNGVVSGYGNGLFGPNDPITREQMATILYRYAQYKKFNATIFGNVSSFSDGNLVSNYAVNSMNWAVGVDLISGVGNNMLIPTGNATRAQVATILMRFCEMNFTPSVEIYTVTFDYNCVGKGTYRTITVEAGETVDKPADPIRSGYSFKGWYTDEKNGNEFDFNTIIPKDITLYAKWEEKSGDNSYLKPSIDNSECTLKISITNSDYSDKTNNIVTQRNSYLLTGIVENGIVSIVDVTYYGYDKDTKVCQVTGTEQWSVEIPLEIGTNIVTVTAYDNNRLFVTKEVTINRTNTEITYSDSVKIADEEDYQQLEEDFVACWIDDNFTEDEIDDVIIILAKDDALLLSQIKNGLLFPGEVYMIPQNEIFVTGFTAVYEYHRAPKGTEEYPIENYPDNGYEEIVFSYPDFADLFEDDISLDFSNGVDSYNPIAFAMLSDGTSIDLQTETQKTRAFLDSGIIGNPLYPKEGWQPQELAKNVLPSAVCEIDQYNRVNLNLNWNDIVIYDHDGIKNDETIDYGQLKLSGKVGITNLQYIGGLEWHHNLSNWELDLLPQQVISKLTYNFGGSLTLKGNASISTTELIETLNDGFDNKSEFWGMSVSGVSSLKNKWVFGVVGLNLVPPSVTFGTTIKGQAAKSTLSPSLILILFIDMDGNITVEGNLSFGYKTEVEKGFNIQKNNYMGSYGSQNQNRSDKHFDIGFDRTLDIYDKNDGSFTLTFSGKVESSLDYGIGVGGGLMIGGICPAVIDGEVFYRAKGLVEGELQFLPEFSANGYASLYYGIGVQTDLAAKLFVDTKIGDTGFDVNKHYEHMFWEQTKSTACLDGRVYVSDDDENNDNNTIIPNAFVRLIKNDTGDIWTTTTDDNGKYKFTGIPDGKYTLEVQKKDYDSYINNNLVFSKKLTQNVFLNQQDIENKKFILTGKVTIADDDTDQTNNLPLEDVTVYVAQKDDQYSTVGATGSDGTFSITLEEGIYNLKFMKDGYKELEMLNIEVNSSISLGTIQLTIISVEPILTPKISGTVKDASTGLALKNVDVYVYDENGYGPYFTAKTSSDGTFSITLEENGTYFLKFIKEGYEENVLNNIIVTSGTALVGIILLTPKISSDDIIYISTPEQFNAIRNNLSAHYVLLNDIDLSGYTSWDPIGNDGNSFSGILDGNGHKITGLKIGNEVILTESRFGLFNTISGTVQNLTVEGANINVQFTNIGDGGEYTHWGIIAGVLNGIIDHCTVSGNMTVGYTGAINAGGITGAGGIVRDSQSDCNINFTLSLSESTWILIGGIIGYNGTTTNCFNSGNIVVTAHLSGRAAEQYYYYGNDSWIHVDGIGLTVKENCTNTGTINQYVN